MRYTKNGELRLSHTLLNTYRDCSTRFWFKYLAHAPQLDRPSELEFGKVLHALFYEFFVGRDRIPKSRGNDAYRLYATPDDFASAFAVRWRLQCRLPARPQPGYRAIRWNPPLSNKYRTEQEEMAAIGYAIARRFYEQNRDVPLSHTAVEVRFSLPLIDTERDLRFTIDGSIDRAQLLGSEWPASFDPADLGRGLRSAPDGQILIIDYKSSRGEPKPDTLARDTQFTCYDWAAEALLWPQLRERRFAIHHLRSDKLIPTVRDEVSRDELKEIVLAVGRGIRDEAYSLNLNACTRCPFRVPCRDLQDSALRHGVDPADLMRRLAPHVHGAQPRLPWSPDGVLPSSVYEAALDGELPATQSKGRHASALQLAVPEDAAAPRLRQLGFFEDDEQPAPSSPREIAEEGEDDADFS